MRRARAEAERRRKQRQRVLTWIGVVVIVALVAAIIFVVVRAASGGDEPEADRGTVVTPSGANDDGGVLVGAEDAPVTLTIYYDYMCPACGAFEQANGAEIDRLLEDDVAQVELRPISFLDRTSQGTRYSTRAANAFATVADQAPDQVWEFHGALYAEQPEEGTSGLSDEELARIARDAGVPDDVVEEFTDLRFEGWVAEVTERAFDSGITGTPTVLIDGEPFEGDLYQPGPLSAAVEAAAEK
jgi:protein-disulfide isomerase